MNDVSSERITRDDLEAKFKELQEGVDTATESARDTAVKAGILVLILVIVLAFLLGRRRGRQGRTVVEIRRV